MRLSKAKIEALESLGVLVQQESEVRGWLVRGRDGKQHNRPDKLLVNQNERRDWVMTVRYLYNYSENENIAPHEEKQREMPPGKIGPLGRLAGTFLSYFAGPWNNARPSRI